MTVINSTTYTATAPMCRKCDRSLVGAEQYRTLLCGSCATTGRSITYSKLDREYTAELDGCYIGSFRSYAAADAEADRIVYEQLSQVADERQDLAALLVELADDADTTSEAQAFTKAAYHVAGGIAPRALDDDALLIPSANSTSVYYTSPISCSCQAGEHGRPCWHRALATATALRHRLLNGFAAQWDSAARQQRPPLMPARVDALCVELDALFA